MMRIRAVQLTSRPRSRRSRSDAIAANARLVSPTRPDRIRRGRSRPRHYGAADPLAGRPLAGTARCPQCPLRSSITIAEALQPARPLTRTTCGELRQNRGMKYVLLICDDESNSPTNELAADPVHQDWLADMNRRAEGRYQKEARNS